MTRVALVTDSTACLAVGPGGRAPEPPGLLGAAGSAGADASGGAGNGPPGTAARDSLLAVPADVRVVPLHVVSDGVHASEDDVARMGPDEVVAFLGGRRVTTSRPSPQVFLDAYEQAARAGAQAVVSVHLSGALSGTVESARLAATAAPVPVEVVDTRTIGAGLLAAVAAAARAADRGADTDLVAATALACADATTTTFYVESLDHLRRGGRIGAAAHLLGSALAMKPILAVTDGAIGVHAKVRTARRALDRLVDDAAAAVLAADHGAVVAVQTLRPGPDADLVEAALRERLPGTPVAPLRLGGVIGAHVGPGVIGVAVVPRLVPGAVGA